MRQFVLVGRVPVLLSQRQQQNAPSGPGSNSNLATPVVVNFSALAMFAGNLEQALIVVDDMHQRIAARSTLKARFLQFGLRGEGVAILSARSVSRIASCATTTRPASRFSTDRGISLIRFSRSLPER